MLKLCLSNHIQLKAFSQNTNKHQLNCKLIIFFRSLNIWDSRVPPPTSIEQTSIRALRSNSASPCPRTRTASRWRTARSPSSVISRLLWDDGHGEPWECHGNGGRPSMCDGKVKPEFFSVFIGELKFKDGF